MSERPNDDEPTAGTTSCSFSRALLPIAVVLSVAAFLGWEYYDLGRGNKILDAEAFTFESLELELGKPDDILQRDGELCWTYSWANSHSARTFCSTDGNTITRETAIIE